MLLTSRHESGAGMQVPVLLLRPSLPSLLDQTVTTHKQRASLQLFKCVSHLLAFVLFCCFFPEIMDTGLTAVFQVSGPLAGYGTT